MLSRVCYKVCGDLGMLNRNRHPGGMSGPLGWELKRQWSWPQNGVASIITCPLIWGLSLLVSSLRIGGDHDRFPRWLSREESAYQCRGCRRPGLDPWVRKIPWRRKWQPTPVFLPGDSHGQRSLAGYSPWGYKESDTTEQLNMQTVGCVCVCVCVCCM